MEPFSNIKENAKIKITTMFLSIVSILDVLMSIGQCVLRTIRLMLINASWSVFIKKSLKNKGLVNPSKIVSLLWSTIRFVELTERHIRTNLLCNVPE